MLQRILLAIILYCFISPIAGAQEVDSLKVDLFSLYENASDQEGMFYLPQVRRGGPLAHNKTINEKRLQAALKNNNYRVASLTAINMAWIELENDNTDKSISYFKTALGARNEMEDPLGAAIIKLQLGFVHYRKLEYIEAMQYFEEALNQLESNRLTRPIPAAQALIAQTFLVQKDFENANSHYLKAYNGFSDAGDKKAQARIGVQLAELALRKQDTKVAEKYLRASLTYFEKVKDKNGTALVYRDLGILAHKEGSYDEAIRNYRKSLTYSNQLSVAKLLKETILKQVTINSVNGNHEASNDWNIAYLQLRDSIDQVERSRTLSSQMMRRDLMEKESIEEMMRKEKTISYQQLSTQELVKNRDLVEAEIDRLEKEKIIEELNTAKRISDQSNMEREERIRQLTKEKALQDLALSQKELEVSRQENFRKTLIIGIISVLVIAILLYARYRAQKKSHGQLNTAYKELSETHHKLVATQEQLVHAQKMASLGQLTAGIAHEIQNPLNFVNNFSELSIELIDELKDPGANQQEILADLKTNLEKINTHGKRADKIVKGMLIHSRNGQEEKQPADLNKMIDELIDLSYHGNRSRDNSFTAEIIRNFDQQLPPVMIVTQDISRVLINLFNNAFYAVGQRAQKEGSSFQATVGVSTRRENNRAIVKIRDNGTGIPPEIVKQIFDPFFTTKPAGEGTGLGLSLSYDIIVKGHDGNLTVTSEPGVFTEFVIELPLS
jgi:two-component system NtrC family sensor kinase